ncbi:RNase P protein subunit [Dictyostelium discoideum AX4]|uniref:RNase P protein subunit n=1 Tax=Dictyostelium discoideum TaxID=44689 RepID=Q54HY6_DICDI|nr:RNase P protein subunit [Dictyostelium discoideum AX4]ABB95688.1 RNase P protein subunit DRpp20 [Dictyostelium discoideum]EAL62877.1 RNase P protein subunit [Dictyostelium discoideum AX4]|eukprot:XP_636377.1 RNase P protein subunit [Dictyostelium discoideum AX4]
MSDTEFEENETNIDETEEDYNEDDENLMSDHKEFLLLNDPTKYVYMRRVVQRPYAKKNEIYLSNNGKFLYYVKRAKNLLFNQREKEIIIHGLGAAISLAVELSLYLQKDIEGLTLSTTTSSEEIIDQYDPLVNDLEPVLKIRHASAIHIKIINDGSSTNPNTTNSTTTTTTTTLTPINFRTTSKKSNSQSKENKKLLKRQELDKKVEQAKSQQKQQREQQQLKVQETC